MYGVKFMKCYVKLENSAYTWIGNADSFMDAAIRGAKSILNRENEFWEYEESVEPIITDYPLVSISERGFGKSLVKKIIPISLVLLKLREEV